MVWAFELGHRANIVKGQSMYNKIVGAPTYVLLRQKWVSGEDAVLGSLTHAPQNAWDMVLARRPQADALSRVQATLSTFSARFCPEHHHGDQGLNRAPTSVRQVGGCTHLALVKTSHPLIASSCPAPTCVRCVRLHACTHLCLRSTRTQVGAGRAESGCTYDNFVSRERWVHPPTCRTKVGARVHPLLFCCQLPFSTSPLHRCLWQDNLEDYLNISHQDYLFHFLWDKIFAKILPKIVQSLEFGGSWTKLGELCPSRAAWEKVWAAQIGSRPAFLNTAARQPTFTRATPYTVHSHAADTHDHTDTSHGHAHR